MRERGQSSPREAANEERAEDCAQSAARRSKAQDGTAKTGARCFYEGYRAGYRGQPLHAQPYPAGTVESSSWAGGWIEGDERRQNNTRKLDENREH